MYLALGRQSVEEIGGTARFAVLQPVKHLLESKSDPLGKSMMAPKDEICTSASDRDRKRRQAECKSKCNVRQRCAGYEGATSHDAGSSDGAARANNVGARWREIGIEPDERSVVIYGNHRSRNLTRA